MSVGLHVSCDTASARAAPRGPHSSHPKLVLATTILASSLAFIDGSVVNVGLPAIGHSLGAGAGALQWIVNAYLLPLSALLLLGGAGGDRFGRRRLLIAGTAVFALASLGCAIAPGIGALFAGRLLQGAGAAMLMPNSLAILGQTFCGAAKGRAIGIWAAAGAATGALGPVLGGWLIDTVSWRAIFLLNLPVAAVAVVLAWRYVRRDQDGHDRPLDIVGGVLATSGLAALTWALTSGSGIHGWTFGADVSGVAAVVLLVAFLLVERRLGERAMMPLMLFASRSFIGLNLLTVCLYGALGGALVLIPYVLITAHGYSATQAGLALLPLPFVLALISPAAGALAGRIGPRLPLTIGPLVVAAGFLLAARIGAAANYWSDVLPSLLVISFGLSGAVAPLTNAVLNSVDARHIGAASGLNSAVARTGGLIAVALLGSVLAAGGALLVSAFQVAMVAAAAVGAAAALSTFFLVGSTPTPVTSAK